MNPLLAALVQAGVISQADADRINRSMDPAAARAWAEQQLAIAVQNGLSAQQQRLLDLARRVYNRACEESNKLNEYNSASWLFDKRTVDHT
jgi:hypothetical protein